MIAESENEVAAEKVRRILKRQATNALIRDPIRVFVAYSGINNRYFPLGEATVAGLSSLLVFRPSGVRLVTGEDVAFAIGDPPFTGEPDGEALGLGATLADADGDGLATVGLFGGVFAFGSHAPSTATLAAKTVDKIIDLLIVFLLNHRKNANETPFAAQTSAAGMMKKRLSAVGTH